MSSRDVSCTLTTERGPVKACRGGGQRRAVPRGSGGAEAPEVGAASSRADPVAGSGPSAVPPGVLLDGQPAGPVGHQAEGVLEPRHGLQRRGVHETMVESSRPAPMTSLVVKRTNGRDEDNRWPRRGSCGGSGT